MHRSVNILLTALAALGSSCSSPPVTTHPMSAVDAPQPYGPTPSARQLAWHELEFYGFVHFTTNTFTGREWGFGDESPAVFAPSDFDPDQIARVAAEAGMRGLILTCKHHDGFCLWDSQFTTHDVASSPWLDGSGDVVQAISDACRRHGLKFGVYLSPWDRNHPHYGSPEYVAYFRNQLRELLTKYGDIFEVWFDGANGGDGYYGGARETRRIDRSTYYGWDETIALVRELQPMACVFSDAGPDVRWVGNEAGHAGDPCWATYTPRPRDGEAVAAPGTTAWGEAYHGHRDGRFWMPAEADVSIRPGWFYHREEDGNVRDAANLFELYLASVGRGAALLLNLPPDRRGRIHEADVAALRGFRRIMDATFGENMAASAVVTASAVRGNDPRWNPQNILDDDSTSYWTTDDDVTTASVTLRLANPSSFNLVSMREFLPLGQRIDAWTIESWQDEQWVPFASGVGIGSRRIARGPFATSDRLRITLHDAAACPAIAEVSVHAEPGRVLIQGCRAFVESQEVILSTDLPGARIRYTLDGSEPGMESSVYEGPLVIQQSSILRARVEDRRGLSPYVATLEMARHTSDSLLDPVMFVQAPESGIRWSCHECQVSTLADLPTGPPDAQGISADLSIAVATRPEHVAVVFEGHLLVPADGIYEFATQSDDGSRLFLHDRIVVDNDGLHGMVEVTGTIGLRAGYHPIRIEWFNATGGRGLDVTWAGPGFAKQPVAHRALFR